MQRYDYIVYEDAHPLINNCSYLVDPTLTGEAYQQAKEEGWREAMQPVFGDATEKYQSMKKVMLSYGESYKIDATIQDICGYNNAGQMNAYFVKM